MSWCDFYGGRRWEDGWTKVKSRGGSAVAGEKKDKVSQVKGEKRKERKKGRKIKKEKKRKKKNIGGGHVYSGLRENNLE